MYIIKEKIAVVKGFPDKEKALSDAKLNNMLMKREIIMFSYEENNVIKWGYEIWMIL